MLIIVKGGKRMDAQTNWTELLEKEYGADPMAMDLVRHWREEYNETDEEIYQNLESFY